MSPEKSKRVLHLAAKMRPFQGHTPCGEKKKGFVTRKSSSSSDVAHLVCRLFERLFQPSASNSNLWAWLKP